MSSAKFFGAENVTCSFPLDPPRKLSDLLFTVAMAPAPILLVNLAGLALVMAVRHQLKEHDTGALSLGEGEKNKKALRAAEHSLIVDSIFLAAWAAGLMGISLFSAIYLRDITNISWSGEFAPPLPS